MALTDLQKDLLEKALEYYSGLNANPTKRNTLLFGTEQERIDEINDFKTNVRIPQLTAQVNSSNSNASTAQTELDSLS